MRVFLCYYGNMKKCNYEFYNSRTWRNKRKEILKRDNYECQFCKRDGRYKRADVVHHVLELSYRYDLALEPSNLLSLCRECHETHHGRVKKADLNIEMF